MLRDISIFFSLTTTPSDAEWRTSHSPLLPLLSLVAECEDYKSQILGDDGSCGLQCCVCRPGVRTDDGWPGPGQDSCRLGAGGGAVRVTDPVTVLSHSPAQTHTANITVSNNTSNTSLAQGPATTDYQGNTDTHNSYFRLRHIKIDSDVRSSEETVNLSTLKIRSE